MIPTITTFKVLLEHAKKEDLSLDKVETLLSSLDNGFLYEDIAHNLQDSPCGVLAEFIIALINNIDFDESVNKKAIEKTVKGYLRHGYFKA